MEREDDAERGDSRRTQGRDEVGPRQVVDGGREHAHHGGHAELDDHREDGPREELASGFRGLVAGRGRRHARRASSAGSKDGMRRSLWRFRAWSLSMRALTASSGHSPVST